MSEQKSGKIINISSIIGQRGSSTGKSPGHCATKAGVTVLTKDMAVAYADMGIQVNAIAPGFFKTNLGADLFKGLSYEEIAERVFKDAIKEIPMGRIGVPEEIKGAAIFLSSRASDYITGHVLVVDGGRFAK